MSNEQQHPDYLDILFLNRNKLYGAYALRRQYPEQAGKALLTVLILAVLLIVAGRWRQKERTGIADTTIPASERIIELQNIKSEIVPPTLPVQPPARAAGGAATVRSAAPRIVADDAVRPGETLPSRDLLQGAVAGPVTQAGNGGTIPGPGDSGGSGNGTGGGGTGSETISGEVLSYTTEMPEFPGSIQEYLGKNLRYPAMARDNGIEGKVLVRFVIAEDGSVIRAEVVRGIGGGCDAEALRVIGSMPPWKPGKQNGKPVKVYYTLPIIFRLN